MSQVSLLEGLKQDLAELAAIPSISAPGYPEPTQPLLDAYELIAELLRAAGLQNVAPLELPGTAPAVTGEIPAPAGAPTVLLYSHYDVVPAGDESLWTSPPFEPTERDGALYGRGTSDSKANVISHVGALRAWDGKPAGRHQGDHRRPGGGRRRRAARVPADAPRRPFACDAMVIADMGSVRPGVPTLTVALRGMAMATIEVTTLKGAKHSGQFGGAAPDALLVVLRALASLHDDDGDVAVAGLRPRGVDGRVLQRRRVPRARRGPAGAAADGHGRARLARLVGAGDHGHGHRRAVGGERAQRRLAVRAGQDQPARAPGAGRRARRRRRSCDHLEARAAVRDRARGARARRPATGSRPTPPARPTRRRARRGRRRGGRPAVNAAGGGSIPLVSALQAAAPDGRGAARRRHRRLLQHPRARRAGAARRAREGDASPRPRSSASTRSAGAEHGRHGRPDPAPAPPEDAAWSGCSTGSSGSATRCPTRRSCSCGSASA